MDLNSLQLNPQKGGAEKQEPEATCNKKKKKMDINIKRGSTSSTSNTALLKPRCGHQGDSQDQEHYSDKTIDFVLFCSCQDFWLELPEEFATCHIVSNRKSKTARRDESSTPFKLAYSVRTQLQTRSLQASASANGICFTTEQLPFSYCRASAF